MRYEKGKTPVKGKQVQFKPCRGCPTPERCKAANKCKKAGK